MPSPLSSVLRQLGYVVLERKSTGKFALVSEAAEWFAELFPFMKFNGKAALIGEGSPFLENFLVDAEEFWAKGRLGSCESGTWVEKADSGKEIPLEAKALALEGKRILALCSPDPQYSERVRILQTARDSLLEHEKLLGEIQKKEILLHCIVHDLSQPLSAMRGSFDCLAMESDAERIAKFIDLGKHASDQQETMIREILRAFSADLQASLDAEKSVNASPDLLVAAQSAAQGLVPAFEAKGVQFSFDEKLEKSQNWHVHGEESRLCRVFTNLLENALRYTPAGGRVTIGIENENGYIKAHVDDEGPGLPGDLRPAQIFALFGKGKDSGGKAGLGLYFCRITVERWGGSIGCISLSEKGSRFWFRLPRAVMAENSPAQGKTETTMVETTQNKLGKRPRLNILLADDQEDIRTLTTHQLERDGHTVVTVANGKAALESACSKYFDVILLDEEMPLMSGVQAARAIREFQKDREARSLLIALTGNNTAEDQERLISAGFDSVLGKPFRLESLETFLRSPTTVGQPVFADKSEIREISRLEDLLVRVGGDEKLLKQMIRTFLRETPKRLETIQKALKDKDGLELAARAHALKGSVSIFGAGYAAEHTHSLQELGKISDFQESARVFAELQEEIAKVEENLRRYAKGFAVKASPAIERQLKKGKKPTHRKV